MGEILRSCGPEKQRQRIHTWGFGVAVPVALAGSKARQAAGIAAACLRDMEQSFVRLGRTFSESVTVRTVNDSNVQGAAGCRALIGAGSDLQRTQPMEGVLSWETESSEPVPLLRSMDAAMRSPRPAAC